MNQYRLQRRTPSGETLDVNYVGNESGLGALLDELRDQLEGDEPGADGIIYTITVTPA